MSQIKARMAKGAGKNQLLKITSFGLAVGLSAANAQMTLAQTIGSGIKFTEPAPPAMTLEIRTASSRLVRSPYQDPLPTTEAPRAAEPATQPTQEVSIVRPDNDAVQSPPDEPVVKAKDVKVREKIVVPAIVIPSTSVQGIGTGATPEDAVKGRLPPMIGLPYGPDRDGMWALQSKTWTAPVFCHQPTYFEDTMLERHGHERCPPIQPLLSGARFFSTIAFQPYLAYLDPPLREHANTGHYRVGTPAPGLRKRAPYDAGAMRFQLLTTGTTVLAFKP